MGLMAPSRKKYDYFTPKAGEFIKQPERLSTTIYSDTRNAAGSTVLYTVPSGRRAKVIYWNHTVMNANTFSELRIGGNAVSMLYTTDLTTSQTFEYAQGIDLAVGQTVEIWCDAGWVGTNFGAVVIVEEEAASGYYVSAAWNF